MISSGRAGLRLTACLLAAAAASSSALAQTTPTYPLQVNVVTANAPNATHSVIEGQVVYNPNTQTLLYCLAAPYPFVDSTCASANIGPTVTANDSGPAGGRTYISRLEQGNLGSQSIGQGKIVPMLEPWVFITRTATVDQSFDGYFVFPLSITSDPNTGLLTPNIGNPF